MSTPLDGEERCENCEYWRDGDCRRKAPVVWIVEVCGKVVSVFPEVDAHMWCAEFLPRRFGEREHPPVIVDRKG
jgi:hypothetical protein